MKGTSMALLVLASPFVIGGCTSNDTRERARESPLVGAWKSNVQFRDGAFAAIKDLRFMYVFNDGGTMTESSNYDAAPPVPPAYGVWKAVGANRFEATYEFYITRPATPEEPAASGVVWLPAGHGVLTEVITMSRDGKTFDSTIRFDAFGEDGLPATGGGSATGHAERIGPK